MQRRGRSGRADEQLDRGGGWANNHNPLSVRRGEHVYTQVAVIEKFGAMASGRKRMAMGDGTNSDDEEGW